MSDPSVRRIEVRYFAVLREQRGVPQEILETTVQTPGQLYAELQEQSGLSLPSSALMVAVNDRFVGWDAALEDGDRVAFIPPVAGG